MSFPIIYPGMLPQVQRAPQQATGLPGQYGMQGATGGMRGIPNQINPNALMAMQIEMARQRQAQMAGMQGMGAGGSQLGAIYGGAPVNQVQGLVPGGTPMPGGIPRPGGYPMPGGGMFPALGQMPVQQMAQGQQPPRGLTGFALANWQAKRRRKNQQLQPNAVGQNLAQPNSQGGTPAGLGALSSSIMGAYGG